MNIKAQHDSALRRRAYRSELRKSQVEATRHRILDAISALLKTNAQHLSVAEVARTARVSLPTVHRHFPTRKDLFEAYRLRVEGRPSDERAILRSATSAAAAAPHVRAFFLRFDDPTDPVASMRRVRPSLAWEFSREVTVPRRQEWAREIIAASCADSSPADRQRLSDLFVVLVSATMGEAMRGYLDRSGRETADRINWAIEALIEHARARRPHQRARRAPRKSAATRAARRRRS